MRYSKIKKKCKGDKMSAGIREQENDERDAEERKSVLEGT